MMKMRLTDKADLGVMYDAEKICWDPEVLKHHGMTKEVYITCGADFPSVGFEIDGKPVGGMLFDGKQVHFAVMPEYYGRWALLLKPGLEWLFSIKDPILADVDANNERCLRFMDRNQWRRVKEDGKTVTYEMTRNCPILTREWNKGNRRRPAEH